MSEFSHPVYQQLSLLNGEVNRMVRADLASKLSMMKLPTEGSKEVLAKRLKHFYKQQLLAIAGISPDGTTTPRKPAKPYYDYFLVIDFEATCVADNTVDFPHEIIEFPAVLVDSRSRTVVASFREYVQPVKHPLLTDFCTDLTGIVQETVDKAKPFPLVLESFNNWLLEQELGTNNTYAIVTDGPWDMARFLAMQCQAVNLPIPAFAHQWVNLRKVYSNYYKTARVPLSVMLELLGFTFEGRPHCGLDDSTNIAKVLCKLLQDGARVRVNERLDLNSLHKPRFDENGRKLLPVLTVSGEDFKRMREGVALGEPKRYKEVRRGPKTTEVSKPEVEEELVDEGDEGYDLQVIVKKGKKLNF